ncbi:MAG TPA: phosphoribosyl-AMP cyclohydrolase [Alphaproteobacteria bacterium]|nr:phosphoribosyl-AMP cyclohydrolase [Alphaproteobacteria bacterium]
MFNKRISIEQVEEGRELAPKFDESGLIPAVTTSAKTGEVLMLGYMNKEALQKTIETGEAHYYSRSRKIIWHKGANSGFKQKIVDLRIDDDQDAVWLNVELQGLEASCHVGYRSCFYRSIPTAEDRKKGEDLIYREDKKAFDPVEVYGDVPNPTIV